VGHGINIYRQSSDEEPDYIVTPKCYASFETPKGNSDIEIIVRNWLKEKS